MSLKIRLARAGTKKRPVYHIVIADSRSPRDGRFIERLGYFNPLLPKDKTERLKLDLDKAKAWLAKGALPTDRVSRFLDEAGVMTREKRNNPGEVGAAQGAQGAAPKQAVKAAAEAKAAAAAAKAAAAGDLTVVSALVADRICVARIGAAHGLRGEVRLNSFTADPMAVTQYGVLSNADGTRAFEIESCRAGQGRADRALQGRRRPHRRGGGCATSISMCRVTGCRRPRPTSSTTPT